MKLINVIFACFCLSIVGGLVCCSDSDDSAPLQPLNPYEDTRFEITIDECSTTACTFTVTPSREEVPYLCLCVDEETFRQVPKDKLVNFLLEDLRQQAQAKGEKLEDFLQGILLTNKQQKRLDHLFPGKIYEVVTVAMSGNTPTKQASYRFFQTPLVDLVDCKFNVNASFQNGKTVLHVQPSVKDEYWYFAALPKANYDKVVAENHVSDEDIIATLFNQDVQNLKGMSMEEIVAKLLKKGDQKLAFDIPEGTGECIWLCVLVKQINKEQVAFASQVATGLFNRDKLTAPTSLAVHAAIPAQFVVRSIPVVRVVQP